MRSDSGSSDLPRLHVLTNREILAREDFLPRAGDILEVEEGRVALHLRGEGLDGGRLFDLAAALMAGGSGRGGALFVNDRLDVALAVGAHGVHLPGHGLAPEDARRACRAVGSAGPRWLGRSVHRPEEVRGSWRGCLDYLMVGTLFDTPSHPGRPGSGVDRIGAVGRAAKPLGGSLPLLGVGGISLPRVPEALEAGAWGVAVIRAVWDEADPVERVREFLRALEREAQ